MYTIFGIFYVRYRSEEISPDIFHLIFNLCPVKCVKVTFPEDNIAPPYSDTGLVKEMPPIGKKSN